MTWTRFAARTHRIANPVPRASWSRLSHTGWDRRGWRAEMAEMLPDEAARLAELRGWSPRILSLTQRGLHILTAVHGSGEAVRASTVRQLTDRNMLDQLHLDGTRPEITTANAILRS